MASESAPSAIKGWIKGVVGSMFGLVGGAVLTYLTPLVENVVKPGKPVANFAYQAQGLNVTFNNRSTGAAQGWWDFGDGSALEAFDPAQDTLAHAYARPGNYTVKLSLANVLGDEAERSVAVAVDPGTAPQPAIAALQVDSLTPGATAPALFRVQASVKDATQCIWSLDDGRPVEITDAAATQDKFITLKDPGTYTVRLVAVNGKQQVQAEKTVTVGYYADAGLPQATLKVTYQAQEVDRQAVQRAVPVEWKAGPKDAVSPFSVTRMLDNTLKDYQIIAVDVTNKTDPRVKNVAIRVTPDRKNYVVTGQLVRPPSWGLHKVPLGAAWLAEVKLGLERRSAAKVLPQEPITVSMKDVGTTAIPIPPLPANCQVQQKQLSLELKDGNRVVYSGPTPPAGTQVMLKNRPVRLTAREANGQLVLDVADARTADVRLPLRPSGN